MTEKEGILLVNKQINKTSFSIVSLLRKVLKKKKIGHSGTLDPLADGLMIMLIGSKYTRLSNHFTSLGKEYLATLHLGQITDTYDSEGEIKIVSSKKPSLKDILEVLKNFQGQVLQVPPMYSAKKINGQKLYNLARKGITIEREPVSINLQTKLIKYDYPYLTLQIICSKGTYVRTIANDIGVQLKCGAFLKNLTRKRIGNFHLHDAIDQAKIENSKEEICNRFIKV